MEEVMRGRKTGCQSKCANQMSYYILSWESFNSVFASSRNLTFIFLFGLTLSSSPSIPLSPLLHILLNSIKLTC